MIFYLFITFHMKFEVNSQNADGKGKQLLYKDVSSSNDNNLYSKTFEPIEKPNLRIYCSGCELQVTRQAHITTKGDYYCIPCFSNLDQYPAQYIVQSSLRVSPTQSQWDLMDEVILITAFRIWGYSNWSQIKEYMDYNQSAFSLDQIKLHYEKFHYNQKDHLLHFPDQVPRAQPHIPYGQVALKVYEQPLSFQHKDSSLVRKESKCEKKPSSNRNIAGIDFEGGLKPSSSSMGQMTIIEAQNRLLHPEKKNECPVLGYNAKRKQFESWYFDPDAEKLLDELQFYESDTPQQHSIKIEMIQQYNRRLDQRAKRKDFVLQYKLLDSHYQFSLKPEQQKASLLFQPFMRYTIDQQEYKNLIDTFTTLTKEQSFITNLMKIRGTTKSGTIDQSYDFLLSKRNKSIKNWQENYNKIYPDKRRRKIYHKTTKEDGQVVLVEEKNHQLSCPFSLGEIDEAFMEVKSKGKYESQKFKLTPLSQMETEQHL